MNYYLAVDGGGSTTTVICANQEGQIIGEGLSGPTSLTATSMGAASFNLREAVRQAIEKLPPETKFQALAMGLAGMDTPAEKQTALKVFSEVLSHLQLDQFILVNDIVIALESGTDNQNAVALIAGTGSNCYGRNSQGEEAKTSGMDYILADQGSGFYIGSQILRAVVKSFDGRGQKTIMEKMIGDYFHLESLSDLKTVVYNPTLSKAEIADLSVICFQALEQKDEVAETIVKMAIEELFLMAATVIDRLKMTTVPLDCILSGGIMNNAYLREQVSQKLITKCSQIKIVTPTQKPVFGALKMAQKVHFAI